MNKHKLQIYEASVQHLRNYHESKHINIGSKSKIFHTRLGNIKFASLLIVLHKMLRNFIIITAVSFCNSVSVHVHLLTYHHEAKVITNLHLIFSCSGSRTSELYRDQFCCRTKKWCESFMQWNSQRFDGWVSNKN